MLKKIMSIVLFFSFFTNTVKAEDNKYKYDAVTRQLELMDENLALENEIVEKIKKVIKPEKQEEAIDTFKKANQAQADFYWLLWDQNVDTIGMGLTDKVWYLYDRQEYLKTILKDITSQESS